MEALYFEDIDTPFEPVYIHIPGHQPIKKEFSKEEARKHYERIEKAKLMRQVWLDEQKKIMNSNRPEAVEIL